MSGAVQFRPQVAEDLQEAAAWYEQRRRGLGAQFLNQFDSTIDKLQRHPLAYAADDLGIRACRFATFPYVVYFRVETDALTVFAVMFGGRERSAWIDRV